MQKLRMCRLYLALNLGVCVGVGSIGCQAQVAFVPNGGGSGSSMLTGSTRPESLPDDFIRRTSAQEAADPHGQMPPGADTVAYSGDGPPVLPIPRELAPTVGPPYVIEPPDVLVIDAVRLIPKPPYKVEPLDVLLIQVTDTPANQPISGPFAVAPEGIVNLGYTYGAVRVVGITVEQAALAIRAQLKKLGLQNAQVSVSLVQFRGVQQIRGEHLVASDGTINLGTYGTVNVTGLTIGQAKVTIEQHLAQYLLDPEVSLSVGAYNSKVYYVIADGGGFGQQIYRFPYTGKEYVLDAISNIGGLPAVSSKRKIWVARPAPAEKCCYQILPVDWEVVTEAGATGTNYQLFPGDRVYIMADPFITLDNTLAKIFSPIERILGITLLGTTTVQSFNSNGANGLGIVPIGIR